jgi:hypothetical protein
MFLAAGAHYVVPDFACVQDVGGSLMVLADQVRRAIATGRVTREGPQTTHRRLGCVVGAETQDAALL